MDISKLITSRLEWGNGGPKVLSKDNKGLSNYEGFVNLSTVCQDIKGLSICELYV